MGGLRGIAPSTGATNAVAGQMPAATSPAVRRAASRATKPDTCTAALRAVPLELDGSRKTAFLRTVQIGDGPEIMLPARCTDAREGWRDYLDSLQKLGPWPALNNHDRQGEKSFEVLRSLEPTRGSGADERPTIAVLVSDPGMLIPGEVPRLGDVLADVRRMGCRAVLVPPVADAALPQSPEVRARTLHEMVGCFDGIIDMGGRDIDPSSYGEANRAAKNSKPEVDQFELAFLKEAFKADAFCFCICRGHQAAHIARGGRLIQDLGEDVKHHNQFLYPLKRDRKLVLTPEQNAGKRFEHVVRFEPDSRMAQIAGERRVTNSSHHQAVDPEHPGRGMRTVGTLLDPQTGEKVLEASEWDKGFSTQFHPESLDRDPKMRALFDSVFRRARIFRIVKQMRAQGEVPSARAVRERMEALPAGTFQPSDFAWLERDLARHL